MHMPTNSNDRPAAVPIPDAEAFDSSRWTHRHDDLIERIIDRIGPPISLSMPSRMNWPCRLAPMRNRAPHCWSATHKQYLDDRIRRRTETARQMVRSFIRRAESTPRRKEDA
jgi:DNA-binding GntR family transcriptional regulator